MNTVVSIGRSFPLGATIAEAGADLSPFSRSAVGVELLFFDDESDARPSRVIRADPPGNSTYHYWHVFGPGVHLDELAAAAVYSKGTLCLDFKPRRISCWPWRRERFSIEPTCWSEQPLFQGILCAKLN
jgi:pullulanase/glycogen debranching enzyme